jgi:cysteine desulfurase
MLPYLTADFGNASSVQHIWGRRAKEGVEAARAQVASVLGVRAKEVIFTSGATEGLNLALKGLAASRTAQRDHLLVSRTEHKAVIEICRALENDGLRVTWMQVDTGGGVDPAVVESEIGADTLGVVVMAANHEVGTIQPIAEIGALSQAVGAVFLCDVVQAVGWIPLDLHGMGVDMAPVSAHKIYGPKGVGALFIRRRHPTLRMKPQIEGGGHERGLRAGTHNVPGIVALGQACELAGHYLQTEPARVAALRNRLFRLLTDGISGVELNGAMENRLPHNLNLAIDGLEGNKLIEALGDVALSSGSACTTTDLEPSHILRALGLPDDRIYASLRMGLGRSTSEADIDYAAERIVEVVLALRSSA